MLRAWDAQVVAYSFGDVELDTTTYEVRRDGHRVPLEPQAFDVLVYLVQHRARVVPKEELMDQIWGGRFVLESAVTSRIKQARRAIGDTGDSPTTDPHRPRPWLPLRGGRDREHRQPHRGRQNADSAKPDPAPAEVSLDDQEPDGAGEEESTGYYTESDGLAIAYQVTGAGDIDIVLVAGFISHLELDWGDPQHAHFLRRLGSFRTADPLRQAGHRHVGPTLRRAGSGNPDSRCAVPLSTPSDPDAHFLLGYSEGGPMATLFAATHPERVAGLILYSTSVERSRSDDYPWAMTAAERSAYADKLARDWDWEADMRLRCPSADPAMTRWWARRCRAAATPTTVRALMRMNDLVDVRDVPARRPGADAGGSSPGRPS